jgi:glucokinase
MVINIAGPKCRCGNAGCFEAIASRTAIFKQIQSAVKEGQKTVLTDMLGDDLKDLRSGDLRKALRRGDKLVDRIIGEAAQFIGVAVGNLINLFSPEVVVLGGGVIEALEEDMLPIVIKTARQHVLAGTERDLQILGSKLGDSAGIIGAAVFARQSSTGKA